VLPSPRSGPGTLAWSAVCLLVFLVARPAHALSAELRIRAAHRAVRAEVEDLAHVDAGVHHERQRLQFRLKRQLRTRRTRSRKRTPCRERQLKKLKNSQIPLRSLIMK
jgi:hypothetical protein